MELTDLLAGRRGPEAVYVNGADFTVSIIEFRFHFGLLNYETGHIDNRASLIMHPMAVKALIRKLQTAVEFYENEYGPLIIPEDDEVIKSLFQTPPKPLKAEDFGTE